MTEKELINDFKENAVKVRKLLEESKNDPENEPYLSKYKAKELLCKMRDLLYKESSNTNIDPFTLTSLLGSVLLEIGIIEFETEELTASERDLTEAESILADHSMKPEVITTLLNVHNNLGILWFNREEREKSKTYLFKAKDLYESFKKTNQVIQSTVVSFNFRALDDNDIDDDMTLEKAHTLTLYYLAQLYGSLEENLKSAIYCHITLRRQLQYSDYEHIDWALNSATLSQYFAEFSGFYQARHHLAASSTVLDEYEEKLMAEQSDSEAFLAKLENFKHRSADVARCWAKYCLMLLANSKKRLLDDNDDGVPDNIIDMSNVKFEDDENICGGDIKNLVFPTIDVSNYENSIGINFLLTYDDARTVFLCCQKWLEKAQEYYTSDRFASDHIEIVQDISRSYTYLSFFEEDDARRAKMFKRRVDMLEELVKEVNPTYYLQYCRQLWYELGEVYSDILNIKLQKLNDTKSVNPDLLKKINVLCEKSIQHFESFLQSVKDKKGNLPAKLEDELVRPVISALAFIGRNSMKRVSVDKAMQLKNVQKSFDSYKTVVDICAEDQNAAQKMAEEYTLCKEMVSILPIKIRKLESQIVEGT